MADIIFDYSALSEAQSYAKKVVTGFSCMDDYKSGLNRRLHSPLDEWKLPGSEPYGNRYVSNAKQEINNKRNSIETNKTQWIDLSNNLQRFTEFLKDTDQAVANHFETTSSYYIDYNGIGGFFSYIGDSISNFVTIDLANSNGITRSIFDWGKEKYDDFSYVKQEVNDWFRHGDGKYVLNIVGSLALTTAAVAGTVLSFLAIPVTGGSSAVVAVGLIGGIASLASTAISGYNTRHTVQENARALSIEDDPGRARFYGNTSDYSDYVSKNDFGSKEANIAKANKAQLLDIAHTTADLVSAGTGLATTFGTKTIKVKGAKGKKTDYTSFDFSSSNVKKNILGVFGFSVKSKSATLDAAGSKASIKVSYADDIGDTTIDAMRYSSNTEYRSIAFEKRADIIGDKKTVTRTATLNNASVKTEYESLVTSNNILTQEYSMYNFNAKGSQTVFDCSKAVSSSKQVAMEKAASDSNLKRVMTGVKNGGNAVNDVTTYIGASDDDRGEIVIQDLVNQNYFMEQVDKYIYKYDVEKDRGYIGGDLNKKTQKFGKEVWEAVTN